MPIFEFSCDKCGNKIEKIISYDESEKFNEKCQCRKGRYKKDQVNKCNFSLKGRWFKTTGSY
jgi:putative FmdB family regulatory protein